MWRTIWRKFLEPMFGGGNLLSGKPPIVCGGPPIGAGGPDIICCGGRLHQIHNNQSLTVNVFESGS